MVTNTLDRLTTAHERLARLEPLVAHVGRDLLTAERADRWEATPYEVCYLPALRRIGLPSPEGVVLQGMADMHVHTEASDGGPIDEVLARAVEIGLDVIAVTDHDTVDGAIEARRRAHLERLPIAVVPGVEVSSADGHIGALFVTRSIPKGLSALETIRAIHEAGGLAVAHHPFVPRILEWACGTKLGMGAAFLDLPLDAVEVTNAVPGGGCRYNIATRELVRRHGSTMGLTGGSDAHHPSDVGKGLTFFAGDDGVVSLRRALEAGATRAAEAYWTTTEKVLYYLRLAWRLVHPPIPQPVSALAMPVAAFGAE